ncbi:MAG: TIGR03621 family F420-dependent LLM class oxidoreductase [Acidimicrobiales bacterium]
MRPFRFAVQCQRATDVRQWRAQVRKIEGLGFSTAYCPDHLDDQWAPIVAMTVGAEATSTLLVGSLVFDVDYRHPVMLAKEMATLDLISEGRLEVGLGAGWLREDYHAAGLTFDPAEVRIERLAETIDVCRGLWGPDPLSFDGAHYHVHCLVGTPRPHRHGGPPILVGGGGPKVLALAAQQADIVGLNASLHEGRLGPGVAQSALGFRFEQRRRWVQEAAGERFNQLELQLHTFLVQVTSTAAQAEELFEALAGGFGLTPQQARTVPMVLAGTVEGICEQLLHHREHYATSYIVIHEGEIDAFAPVVARLAGT